MIYANGKRGLYKGSQKCRELYRGNTLLYSSQVLGYWIHKTTGAKTYFNASGSFSKPSWATNAKEVVLPPNVTSIGTSAFGYCPDLVSIEMSNVTSIETFAFSNCTALVSVDLPNVVSMAASVFYNCTALVSVKLPNVTSIESSVFSGCAALVSVELSNVTSIEINAFRGCAALTSITLPSSITQIGNSSFYLSGIKTIVCLAPIPPTIISTSIPTTTTSIKVPAASVNAYKAAPYWSNYASIIEAI